MASLYSIRTHDFWSYHGCTIYTAFYSSRILTTDQKSSEYYHSQFKCPIWKKNPFRTFKLSCSYQLYNEINVCVSLWRIILKANKLEALAQGICVRNLNHDLDKLIKLRRYQHQCVCQVQEQSAQEFWSYPGRTIFTGWSPHMCEESYHSERFSV